MKIKSEGNSIKKALSMLFAIFGVSGTQTIKATKIEIIKDESKLMETTFINFSSGWYNKFFCIQERESMHKI